MKSQNFNANINSRKDEEVDMRRNKHILNECYIPSASYARYNHRLFEGLLVAGWGGGNKLMSPVWGEGDEEWGGD